MSIVVSASLPKNNNEHVYTRNGLRPVNLRTDLAPLADLIELVFADTMDNSGRAALREMRMMSRLGIGLNAIARLNDLALGINMGYVWIEDGKLVGNVSIYPAHWQRDLGSAWIIANVGVHPDYQGRGIAKRLMYASLETIQRRGGTTAILQVDHDNFKARNLYTQLGFVDERTWVLWRRPGTARLPLPIDLEPIYITHRSFNEWRAEYALAQQVRPPERGGLGWLRPLHPSFFRPNFAKWVTGLFSLRHTERLIIRSEDTRSIRASLWVETGFGSSVRLTLMVHPDYVGIYDEALLNTVVRRFGGDSLVIEHPLDETITSTVLERYRFNRQRTIVNMRWDIP